MTTNIPGTHPSGTLQCSSLLPTSTDTSSWVVANGFPRCDEDALKEGCAVRRAGSDIASTRAGSLRSFGSTFSPPTAIGEEEVGTIATPATSSFTNPALPFRLPGAGANAGGGALAEGPVDTAAVTPIRRARARCLSTNRNLLTFRAFIPRATHWILSAAVS